MHFDLADGVRDGIGLVGHATMACEERREKVDDLRKQFDLVRPTRDPVVRSSMDVSEEFVLPTNGIEKPFVAGTVV